jgi:hypothetical protein
VLAKRAIILGLDPRIQRRAGRSVDPRGKPEDDHGDVFEPDESILWEQRDFTVLASPFHF